MSVSSCQACGMPIVWAAHHESGKLAPIVNEPSEDGNILVWRAWSERLDDVPKLRYAIVSGELHQSLCDLDVPLRINHFADCPNAERFRSRND